ncbi:MAG TPA: rhodanese-like domain-containing protein, partial [Steroidobacteraceae bacterium]|nr:rhodanese-like domain-containing protein [Steroidobacteraceae bacterium]
MQRSLIKLALAVSMTMPLTFAAISTFAQSSAAVQPAGKQAESKAHVLSRAELDALLAKPGQLLIVDVRRPDELISIGGFPVYLSIQAADLEKHLAYLPKDRTIVTVSNHAGRAKRAVDLLIAK